MNVLKDDYIGFSFNDVHSFDLGIMRVSDGSRYNENLLPTSQDKTVQVPGRDETYYFGSTYTQRVIPIQFVFDGITEQQLSYIKELFGDKKIHPLVLDETPYKKYYAKVTGSSTIKYLPFPEGNAERVYKGEGTLEFTCYNPYAICEKKDLAKYDANKAKEWNGAANLVNIQDNDLDVLVIGENDYQGSIKVYNPGSKETNWNLLFFFEEDGSFPGITIELENKKIKIGAFQAKDITNSNIPYERDVILSFNSETELVEGMYPVKYNEDGDNFLYKRTGNIYNEFIQLGNFFKIPITITKTPNSTEKSFKEIKLTCNDTSLSLDSYFNSIIYNYFYL